MIPVAAAVAASIGVGALVQRRHGARAQEWSRLTLTALLYGFLPIITFFNVVRLDVDATLLGGLGLSIVALTLTGLLAYAAARALGLSRPVTGSVITSVIQPNTGYLGVPVTAAVLGSGTIGLAVAVDATVSLFALYLGAFAVGAAFGTEAGEGARERARAFFTRNPPLWALVLGLLAPDALAPDALVDVTHVLVFAVAPLGFFAVGVTLAAETRGRGIVLDRAVLLALAGRLLVAPLLLLALAAPVLDLPDTFLVMLAMPAGINGLVVAHAYGLDLRVTASAIAYGTGLVLLVGVVAELIQI